MPSVRSISKVFIRKHHSSYLNRGVIALALAGIEGLDPAKYLIGGLNRHASKSFERSGIQRYEVNSNSSLDRYAVLLEHVVSA